MNRISTMMKQVIILAAVLAVLTGCKQKESEFDATGTFEAVETTVYAEQSGALIAFNVDEGQQIGKAEEIGLVDTTQIWLNIQQADAAKTVYQSQKPDMQKQIATTRQQLEKAQQEQQRYKELVADGAAPSKLLDDAKSQVRVLQRQLEAQISSLNTSTNALNKQMAAVDVEVRQLQDQLRKCHILSPSAGTVVEKYVERGEYVSTGKPLFKLADTKNMYLRAYVTTAQLKDISLGQQVEVFADYGNNQRKQYKGRVVWISKKSEFTPKTILTDDERADLVYAIKVAVDNDDYIKMGMYGEVKLK